MDERHTNYKRGRTLEFRSIFKVNLSLSESVRGRFQVGDFVVHLKDGGCSQVYDGGGCDFNPLNFRLATRGEIEAEVAMM